MNCPVRKRTNAGFEIVQCITIGDIEIVLGHYPQSVTPFVTWESRQQGGRPLYYSGHYHRTERRAQVDFRRRAARLLRQIYE